ncbi:MAG: peptidylprolyl isomerase [Bacteroidota bacterium]
MLSACSSPESGNAQSGDMMVGDVPIQTFPINGDLAASHILVSYDGAQGGGEMPVRTKEEALAKAQDLIRLIQEDPSRFGELATVNSDDPGSAANEGNLGAWTLGRMVPPFEEATQALEPGEFTTEPVETAFGYHIIRRNSNEVPHFFAQAFFISYTGAFRAPAEITRTKEEALALAASLDVTPDNFDDMAAEHNDFGDGPIALPILQEGEMPPPALFAVMDSLQTLGFDDVAGPIEVSSGIAFIQRERMEQLAGSHILIMYAGAMRAPQEVTRTKEEAQAFAEELMAQIQADPSQFEALAAEHSDGPSGPQGGDLNTWFKGMMVPAFDAAIVELAPGEVAPAPVETDFGFHIIRRNATP